MVNNYKHRRRTQIEQILTKYQIAYEANQDLLVKNSIGHQYIAWPDYYLPEFHIAIECFSLSDYDEIEDEAIVKSFEQAYKKTHLHLISIPPIVKKPPWPGFPILHLMEYKEYILGSIETHLKQKLKDFQTKTQNSPKEYGGRNEAGHLL